MCPGTPHLLQQILLEVHLTQRPPLPDWDELDEGEIRTASNPDAVKFNRFSIRQFDRSLCLPTYRFSVAEKFLSQQLIRELHTMLAQAAKSEHFMDELLLKLNPSIYPIAEPFTRTAR